MKSLGIGICKKRNRRERKEKKEKEKKNSNTHIGGLVIIWSRFIF